MHIAVIGAGAIGSFMAAALTRSGNDVTLIARGERLAWLGENAIAIESSGTIEHTKVSVAGWSQLTRAIDLAIFCTKTSDLRDALDAMSANLAPDGTILTLQNGVEAPYQAARAFPHAAILTGRVHGFFEMDGPQLRHVGVPPSLVFGGISGNFAVAQARVTAILTKAALANEIAADIVTALWEKLMLVASLSGVASALGIAAGQVCRTADGEAMLRRALGEVAALGRACGAQLGSREVEAQLRFVRSFPESATTSLQRDLKAGKPSEYDALIGTVLHFGSAKGVPLPLFTEMNKDIRSRYPDAYG